MQCAISLPTRSIVNSLSLVFVSIPLRVVERKGYIIHRYGPVALATKNPRVRRDGCHCNEVYVTNLLENDLTDATLTQYMQILFLLREH